MLLEEGVKKGDDEAMRMLEACCDYEIRIEQNSQRVQLLYRHIIYMTFLLQFPKIQ